MAAFKKLRGSGFDAVPVFAGFQPGNVLVKRDIGRNGNLTHTHFREGRFG